LFVAVDAGASIKEIQELAGHKSIVMSARYSYLSPEHRLSVVERIAGNNHQNSHQRRVSWQMERTDCP
jgi:hypothetical protein